MMTVFVLCGLFLICCHKLTTWSSSEHARNRYCFRLEDGEICQNSSLVEPVEARCQKPSAGQMLEIQNENYLNGLKRKHGVLKIEHWHPPEINCSFLYSTGGARWGPTSCKPAQPCSWIPKVLLSRKQLCSLKIGSPLRHWSPCWV